MKIPICLLLLNYLTPILGSRILGIFITPRESHFVMYESIMKGLLEAGHEVDVVSYFPQQRKIPRYTDIDLSNNLPLETHNLSIEVVENYEVFATSDHVFQEYGVALCDKLIVHPKIKKLKETTKKYDLLIAELYGTDCLLGFADLFKVPIVGVLGDIMNTWASDRMGNPENPSYMPTYLLPYGSKMSLQNRVLNTWTIMLYKIGWIVFSVLPSELRSRKLFGPNVTPIDILAYNTSLLLVNSHFSVNFPRPMVPNILEVAGIHIGKPKPLPAQLQKFTKVSKPLIYVVLDTKTMTKAKLNIFVEALSGFSNPVIWRGQKSDIFGHVPKNFYIDEKELVKLDVLCNNNTGLLITNGDGFLLQEAVYCEIPIIGLPLIADHEIDVRNYVRRGLAIKLQYEDFSKNEVLEAVNAVLTNNTYKKAAKETSRLYKDRPITPMDEAIFWIEYVMRYSGARHLRTVGADLIWMEYYNVDVGMVFTIFGLTMLLIFQFLFNYLNTKFTNKSNENKKID